MAKKSDPRILSAVVLALGAVLVGYVSYVVLWLGDDIDYGFYIQDYLWNSYGTIDNVREFFWSQGNHYVYVNGRYVAHVLVQLYCAVLGQGAFSVSNALIYILFVLVVCRMSGLRRPLEHPRAVLTVFGMTLLTFVTKMMPSTQIGFVWMFTLNLIWLRLYLCPGPRRRWWQWLGVTALGVLAGNGQEALTIGLCAALGLRWWCHFKWGWSFVALLAYGFGVLVNCVSPGTLNRASTTVITMSDSLIYMAMSLRAVYVLVAVAVWQVWHRRTGLRKIYRQNGLYINAMIVLMAFNLAIGVYSNRQLFGIELMALLVTLRILPHHAFSNRWVAALTVAVLAFVTMQIVMIRRVNAQYDEIMSAVHASKGGYIYYDRTRVANDIFNREFKYFEELVGPGYADTHHSLQKHVKALYPDWKYIHIRPSGMKPVIESGDSIYEYAPGHYVAIIADTASRVVVHNRIPVIGSPARTDTIVPVRPVTRGKGWNAYIIVESRPFVEISSVSLARDLQD